MEDLISRQAAIDALDRICDSECEYSKKQRAVMCASCHLGSAFDAIDELPRRGRWITVENSIDYYPFMCSECYEMVVKRTNYCPNCGARMDLGE